MRPPIKPSSRGKIGPLGSKLGNQSQTSMGPLCCKARLQDSIRNKASTFPNSNPLPTIKELSLGRGSPKAPTKKGRGEDKTGSTGVLLSDFPHPKKRMGNCVSSSICLGKNSGVHDGNNGQSQTSDSAQQLGFLPRLDRCLPAYPHSQNISEIPSALFSGSGITVPGIAFQSGN